MRGSIRAFAIAFVLFFIPFFWLKPGLVDLGGDSGRLYFLDPLASALSKYQAQNPDGAILYAFFPYELFLSVLKLFVQSPTYLIAVEHGLQLSIAFLSIYFILKTFIKMSEKPNDMVLEWIAVLSGIVYAGFITKTGWIISLETHNQVFLNPLIFLLLLQFCLTAYFRYAFGILLLSLLYSGNFGFSAMPQIASFYPFSCLFLVLLFLLVLKKPFPFKKVFYLGVTLFGLHAFHWLPMVATIFDTEGSINTYIFSKESVQNAGVTYFDFNRQALGKLSFELFQPAKWNGQTIFIIIIPLITFLGFLKKKSKLLALTGGFFAITFFLVSANITLIGVKLYRKLFYIPGFMMFRSFDEKWFYVFIFFYSLLFGISAYLLLKKSKRAILGFVCGFVVLSILVRIWPFLQGQQFNDILYESKNVPSTFEVDPDWQDALSHVKTLPHTGKILTLPLTLPYFQIVHGKGQGAYVGISSLKYLAARIDIPGFWLFGSYKDAALQALQTNDERKFWQILSLLNIRYIFRNTDPRIMDEFPRFPYYKYDITQQIPAIDNQATYDTFFSLLPMIKLYEKGFFRISEIEERYVRPTFYAPNILFESQEKAIQNESFRSGFVDNKLCSELSCNILDESPPLTTFNRNSQQQYDITFDVGARTKPFVLVLSEPYHQTWTLRLKNGNIQQIPHIRINDYANGWIIDPVALKITGVQEGTVSLEFQKYFLIGRYLSIAVGLGLLGHLIFKVFKK